VEANRSKPIEIVGDSSNSKNGAKWAKSIPRMDDGGAFLRRSPAVVVAGGSGVEEEMKGSERREFLELK